MISLEQSDIKPTDAVMSIPSFYTNVFTGRRESAATSMTAAMPKLRPDS